MSPWQNYFLLLPLLVVRAHSYFPSIPEDPYAFPKYRVSFLNGFSLPNATAHRWLTQGLKAGEAEFLAKVDTPLAKGENPSFPKAIEPQLASLPGGGTDTATPPPQSHHPTLQLLRIGTNSLYLCLIPPPPSPPSPSLTSSTPASAARSPASSWELLQPMSQGCLYYPLGWFTYAYCHNKYVKQFREAPHAHPHPPGGRIPQEDTDWESYFLGIAPSPEMAGSDVASPEHIAAAHKLELARGAGQRYLVQKWEDGSICDKTNQPRKIEVQFHCSMTTPDKILLIKETSVCSYVLVIHTPRLCGEPGFKSERASQDESVLRCRQVLPDEEYAAEQAALIADQMSSSSSSNGGGNQQKHMTKAGSSSGGGDSIPYVESMHPFRIAPEGPERAAATAPDPNTPAPQAAKTIQEGLGKGGDADNKEAAAAAGSKNKNPTLRDSTEALRRAIKDLLKGDDDNSGEEAQGGGEGESTRASESDKSTTKSDDSSESKAGSKPTDREGLIAEIFGNDPQNVVTVEGEDGTTSSYIIIDHVEEVNDLDDAAAAESSYKRLDAIRKRLLEALKDTGNTAAAADGKKDKQEYDDGSSSSDDDGVPVTHDEL